jgi:ribosomal protein L37AE/L43A
MNNDITCYTCMTLLKEDDAERFAGVWTCDDCHERLVDLYFTQDLDKHPSKG